MRRPANSSGATSTSTTWSPPNPGRTTSPYTCSTAPQPARRSLPRRAAAGRDEESLNVAAGACVDPVGVSSAEDGGVLVGCEGVIVDHRTEVWRLGVSDDPTLITIGGKARADKVVHPHRFGSSDLHYSVDRGPDSRAGHGGGDIVRGDRTEQRVWQPDNVSVCRGIGQANREFVERSCAHDRIGLARILDQVFLSCFRGVVAAVWHDLRAHYGQCDMVFDSRFLFSSKKIRGRGREEAHHGFIVEQC